jgi:PAS domain S-box-containing protein
MMMIRVVVHSMVAGILFYTSYQFLFIGLRNKKHPEFVTFGFIVLLQAISSLVEFFGFSTDNQAQYIVYRQAYYNLTSLINILFFFFISIISGYRHQALKWIYLLSVTIAFLINNTTSHIYFSEVSNHSYIEFITPQFFRHWHVSSTWSFGIINAFQFIIFSIFAIQAYILHKGKDIIKARFILLSVLFFIMGSIFDAVIDFGLVHYPLSSFLYLALVIYISNKLFKDLEYTKRYKDEAAEREQRLRQIIDLVPNLIFAKDENGCYIFANKALAISYGTTPEKLRGYKHSDFIDNIKENDFFWEQDQKVFQSGNPVLIPEEKFTDKAGNNKILQTVKIPYTFSGTRAILGVSTDITQLKKSEEILKGNEQLLEAIFDSASVAMVLIDNKSEVLKINKAAKDLGLETTNKLPSKPGNALNCIVAGKNKQGCGNSHDCSVCTLRSTIHSTFSNKTSMKQVPHKLVVKNEFGDKKYSMLLSTSIININGSEMVLLVMEDITAMMEAEKALTESEYRYKQITRAITDYIYSVVIEENNIVTIHTPACVAITGYGAEEFEADNSLWFDIIVDSDREKVLKFIREVTNGKQTIEYRIIRKDGTIHWVSNTLVIKKYKKNNITLCDGIVRDITERKRAEENLANQNQMLNTMLDNLPIGIFMVTAPDGIPLIANEHAKNLLGRGILPATSMENLTHVYKAFKAGTNQPYPTEEMPVYMGMHGQYGHIDDLEVERPDGTRTLLEIIGCPVYNTNNSNWASLVGFYDITERKKAELELKEAKEHLEMIFNTTPDAVVIIRFSDGVVINMNEGFSKMTGYSFNEIIDNKIQDIWFYENSDERNSIAEIIKSNGSCHNQEAIFKRKDGSLITGIISAKLINLNGVQHVLSVTRDISERKAALDELRESEEKFRNIFNTSNDAILITDFEGNILEVNSTTVEHSGFPLEALKRVNILDLVDVNDKELIKFQLANILNRKGFIQTSYINGRGEKLYIEIVGHTIHYNGSEAILLISRDMSERKIMEQ